MKRLSWWIIVLFLFFLPFQGPLQRTLNLSRKFLWMDEIFVAFSFGLFFFVLLYKGKIKKIVVPIILSFLLLGIIGIISGLYNGNSFVVTVNGIFDYVKNFLVIPIFCLFSIQSRKVQGLYNMLHRLAIFLCFVAILQEVAFFLGFPVERIGVSFTDVRFGLMRTPSLMGHPNIFGLYALLFFILDFSYYRRMRWQSWILVLGVFLSVSRMVWVAFFFALFYLLIQKRGKKAMGLFVLTLVIIVLAIPSFYLRTTQEMGYENYFRGYALRKSIEIWNEHPLLGVGPGMYGGVASFVFDSPIYGQCRFNQDWFDVVKNILSLDQFWPQILVEMGILGALSFGFLLFVLWRAAKKESLTTESSFRMKMLSGLSAVPIILMLYLIGSGLNLTPFLLSFSILLGMVMGMRDENPISQ